MEGGKEEMPAAGNGSPVGVRWNPTTEQISMLESLYRQGVRTPSTEQIQEITNRLKAYGHIEGKNVFYWFQNHKARQRQKQKQENMACFNRYLHNTPTVFSPPPNVVYGPYYMPQTDLRFCPPCPKLVLPAQMKRRPKAEKVEKPKFCGGEGYDYSGLNKNEQQLSDKAHQICNNKETLALFPLQPTGILQGKSSGSSSTSGDAEDSTTTPSSSSENTSDIKEQNPAFFHFFWGNSFSERH